MIAVFLLFADIWFRAFQMFYNIVVTEESKSITLKLFGLLYGDYKGFANDYFRFELLKEINGVDSRVTNFKDL